MQHAVLQCDGVICGHNYDVRASKFFRRQEACMAVLVMDKCQVRPYSLEASCEHINPALVINFKSDVDHNTALRDFHVNS